MPDVAKVVTIAGRTFDVKPATLGFRKHTLWPWKRRFNAASGKPADQQDDSELIDLQMEGIMLYIGASDDTKAFLEANVVDGWATLTDCMKAAGQITSGSSTSGEALRQ